MSADPQEFSNCSLLERAFELAGTAGIRKVAEIRAALVREGYSNFHVSQLALRSLSKQLQARIKGSLTGIKACKARGEQRKEGL